MPDFIADNFGPLELLLFIEAVVLLTATFFYQAAKLISRNSRHDPMVRFYRIFWRAFFSDVTPVGVMLAREAEVRARAMGMVMVGDLNPEQLKEMDAPDLNALSSDDMVGRAIESPVAMPVPMPSASASASKPKAGPSAVAAPLMDATLDVRIVGRSKADVVAGRAGRVMLVHVRNEVEDGHANGVVVDLAAKALGIPVYRIVLLRGHYKEEKAFKIIGIDQTTLDRKIAALNADERT